VQAARCHAKLILLAPPGDLRYVWYGSGNLRTNDSIEQMAACCDPQVYDFYRQSMAEVDQIEI
jgi:hypothetical protein